MKALFCTLASHGFVYPALSIAQVLRRQGHTVAFVTGPAFKQTLEQLEMERIPRGARDGASFQVESWFPAMSVAMQVKHIEYAIDRFEPDVLVSHQLSLGVLIVAERTGLPVAILGFAAYLWPISEALASSPPGSDTHRSHLWRHTDMMRYFNEARALFKLPPSGAGFRDSPLLGDVFMLQSSPELVGDIDDYPARVHLVGACLWEPPASDDLQGWLAQSRDDRQPLLYVHHGRSFDSPSFWPHVVDALSDKPVRVAAAIGRMDRDAPLVPPNFFVRPHLSQGAVLREARMAICGGNTTPALGALTHGVPSLILPGGGEQQDVARQIARAGAARCLPLAEANAKSLGQAVEDILGDAELTRRAQAVGQALLAMNGPARAAGLIERLASQRSPILRGAGDPHRDVCS